jgi:hypothetical protein
VTIGSSNIPHLKEILMVQKFIRDEFELSPDVCKAARVYAQNIYEQFQLGDSRQKKLEEDQEFNGLL